EQRHDLGLGHRLAVEALDGESLCAQAANMGDDRLERRAEPHRVGLAKGEERPSAALDEEHRLPRDEHDESSRNAGRPRPRPLRPGNGPTIGLSGIGGRDYERRLVVSRLAKTLDRAGKRELRSAEAFDEVAATA